MSAAPLTTQVFYKRLSERVSDYNARLVLNQALHHAGLNAINEEPLDGDVAKNLCLELIKRGGPAFHVGQALYRELQ